MHRGEAHTPVPHDASCMEIESLVVAFNEMAETLEEREAGRTLEVVARQLGQGLDDHSEGTKDDSHCDEN